MKRLRVKSSLFDYQIVMGRGAWRSIREIDPSRYSAAIVLTEQKIWRCWGRAFQIAVELKHASVIFVPPGEASKSLKMVERVTNELTERGADRRSLLIAFGGGMVGDLAGFVASIYMRGIDFIQIPTTVLAQVDSSIGGKTGVDVGASKNVVGTFYPPRIVLADPMVLSSLDVRTFRSGLFEVVKHAFLAGGPLYKLLEKRIDELAPSGSRDLDLVLALAAEVKVEVVNRDEREAGLRRVLNLGHTLGHAIEEASGYRRFLHGEAVGWGMLCAIRLATLLGCLPPDQAEKMAALIRRAGPLPSIGGLRVPKLIRLLPRDKKAVGGRIHWVIPRAIGKVVVTADVPLELAARAFREVQRTP